MNTRLLFGLLWLMPTLCFGALSTDTSYFLNVEALTNVTARSAVSGLTGVFTNSLSAAGLSTSGTTNATLTGNLLANGATFTNGITAGTSTFTGTLETRNGTTPMSNFVYNTYTSDTSYERAAIKWVGNILDMGNEAGSGGGSQRQTRIIGSTVTIRPSGTSAWQFSTTGHLNAVTDGAVNIGTAPSSRPGDGNFAGIVTAAKAFQSYQGTLTHAGTVTLNFNGTTTVNTLSLTGDVTFATSNLATNRTSRTRIIGVSTNATPTFPAWKFLGGAPSVITASQVGLLTLEAWGPADTDVLARYEETQ